MGEAQPLDGRPGRPMINPMDLPGHSRSRSKFPRTLTLTLVASVGLAGGLAGCGSSGPSASTASTTSTVPASDAATTAPAAATAGAVVKDILSTDVDPPGAPGSTLTLIRYTIPPGAKLAPHTHPGVQMASIQSGTLSYTVVSGTATVKRADGSIEQLAGPTSTKLDKGDSVIELDGMVHFGADDTTEPVIILATLLTQDGKDLAVPVTQPPG